MPLLASEVTNGRALGPGGPHLWVIRGPLPTLALLPG